MDRFLEILSGGGVGGGVVKGYGNPDRKGGGLNLKKSSLGIISNQM